MSLNNAPPIDRLDNQCMSQGNASHQFSECFFSSQNINHYVIQDQSGPLEKGRGGSPPPHHHFFEQKIFFVKSENIKFLYVNNK